MATQIKPRVGRVIPGGNDIKHVEQDIEQRFESHFITAHDGFIAVDKAGQITVGVNPSAVEHNIPSFKIAMEYAAQEDRVARPRHQHHFQCRRPDDRWQSNGSGRGEKCRARGCVRPSIARRPEPSSRQHCPRHDQRLRHTCGGNAKVLVLPRKYDGPIFISDIDDTLRATDVPKILKGERQPPIDGVEAILSGVAGVGVPLIYLSAGTTAIPARTKTSFLSFSPESCSTTKTGTSG